MRPFAHKLFCIFEFIWLRICIRIDVTGFVHGSICAVIIVGKRWKKQYLSIQIASKLSSICHIYNCPLSLTMVATYMKQKWNQIKREKYKNYYYFGASIVMVEMRHTTTTTISVNHTNCLFNQIHLNSFSSHSFAVLGKRYQCSNVSIINSAGVCSVCRASHESPNRKCCATHCADAEYINSINT